MNEKEVYSQTEWDKTLETLQFTQYSVDTISDAILWINEKGKYIFVNHAACELYGYSKSEMLSMYMFKIDPLFDEEKWKEHWNLILEKNTFKLETINKTKEGKEFPIEVTVNLVEYNGQKYNCAIVRDISEQKKYERNLKENAERLKNLNAIKDKFFSIIAHDLRGPLGNYRDFTQLLNDKNSKITPDEKNIYLELLEKSSSQIYSLLENLLEWARSQNGTMPFNPQTLSIYLIVEKIISLFSVLSNKKQIQIQNKLKQNLLIFADAYMIETVFRNLISNALKFTSIGGLVEIGTTQTSEDEPCIFYVKDNGMGMKEDRLNKLFLLNEKISTKGTKGETGSGLGLILAKEFLERHNGKIWVESVAGEGSTFHFQI